MCLVAVSKHIRYYILNPHRLQTVCVYAPGCLNCSNPGVGGLYISSAIGGAALGITKFYQYPWLQATMYCWVPPPTVTVRNVLRRWLPSPSPGIERDTNCSTPVDKRRKHWKGGAFLLQLKHVKEFSELEAKQTNKEIKQHLSWQRWEPWGPDK